MSQDLFIEAPAFEKVATIKLSQDVSQWPLEIIQHLHEEHPYLAEKEADIVFKKQDKVRGYGYGFLKIGENIRVPIIVNQYQMKPLDVWLDNDGKSRGLDENAIKSATQSTQIGKPVKPQTAGYVDSLIYSRTYPPYDGKYVYATAIKEIDFEVRSPEYMSLLSSLGLSQDEKKAHIEGLPHEVIAGMKQRGTLSVLTDWMTDDSENINAGWEKVAAEGLVRKSAKDYMRYRSQCRLPDAIIKDDVLVGDVQSIKKFGIYLCEGISGEKYKGHVFPHVYDFDLKPMEITMFTGRWMPTKKDESGQKCSCVQAQIAGQKMPEDSEVYDDHGRNGDRGFFCMIKGNAAIALPPVKILAHSSTREHHETRKETDDYKKRVKIETDYTTEKFHCQTDLGSPVTIIKSHRVSSVVRVGQEVHIPSSFVFCRLHKAVRLKSDPEIIKKAAQEGAGVNELRVRHIDGVFAFEGAGVSYDSFLRGGVTQQEASEFLEKTWEKQASDKIINRVVGKNGQATTIHVAVPRLELEKDASADPAHTKEVAATIAGMTEDFDKIAATLQDSGLVDTVLSLKFLSPENLGKYAEFIPQFEEATEHLADLLIAARIGLSVEERPIKTAMESMSMVVKQLKTVKGK